MNRGIITYFNEVKNFGFIRYVTGENYFFHLKFFAAAVRPERWMKVKFESMPDEKGGKCDIAIDIVPDDEK